MGGAALKTTFTRRYAKDEYIEIAREIEETVPFEICIPKSYKDKDTFGDLDVLIRGKSFDELVGGHMYDYISKTFKPKEIYPNSHVISFDYKELQIDFIKVKENNWETSKIYFSFNDLGNFMGRIAYKMGFRYGDFGLNLVYLHEDGGKKFTMNISKDPKLIFTFLGFDWEKYLKGFDSLEKVFNFVVKSKYFDARLFDYENLNHQNRTRNKKRVNYTKFLDHVKSISHGYKFEDKDFYVNMADGFFGTDIANQISLWKNEVDLGKIAAKKFGGDLIMERYPDLKGKELGVAIVKFKNYIKSYLATTNDNVENAYHTWLINSDIEHIFMHFDNINNL